MTIKTNIKTIGVVGAGTMGSGIAQVFAAHGYRVKLVDINEAALQRGLNAIDNSLARLLKKELVTEALQARVRDAIETSIDIALLADCDFAVEAATENAELKFAILGEMDAVMKPQAIIASNTSSISLTRLAAQTNRAEKVIGMHFMNPVPLMVLVEIIRALQTSDETCEVTKSLTMALGKTPVMANDSPGFVANRILCPMINEAIFTVYEGVASPKDVDEIMKLGMHHPIGPLALADLIGLDVLLSVMRVLHDGMGDSKFRPCPLLIKMVDANQLGRKTGKGFYDYARD